MKTNHIGHALRNLTNRVMAVLDDGRKRQAAVEALESPAGVGLQVSIELPRARDVRG